MLCPQMLLTLTVQIVELANQSSGVFVDRNDEESMESGWRSALLAADVHVTELWGRISP